jgi:hypothetical protein
MPIGQGPAGFDDDDQLAYLDKRELARLHLHRHTPPSLGHTYSYGGNSRDPKVMYPLDEAEVAKVAAMIEADMRPQ